MPKYYNPTNESVGVLGDGLRGLGSGSFTATGVEKRSAFDQNFLKKYQSGIATQATLGRSGPIPGQTVLIEPVPVDPFTPASWPPTTSDSQCHWRWLQQAGQECWARDNITGQDLDPSTCKYYNGRCYSTTAKQCTSNKQCGISWNGECKNKTGGSSLNCRHAGFLGSCSCVSK